MTEQTNTAAEILSEVDVREIDLREDLSYCPVQMLETS